MTVKELQKLYSEYVEARREQSADWNEEDYWGGVFSSNKQMSDRFVGEFFDWLKKKWGSVEC